MKRESPPPPPPPPSSTPLDLAADGGDLRGSPTLTKMLNKRLPWGAPRDVKQLIWMEDKIATFIHFEAPVMTHITKTIQ